MSVLMKGKNLRKMWNDKGGKHVLANLQEMYDTKEITPEDFSFRDLASNLIEDGHEMVADWDRSRRRGGHIATEAVHAVDTSAMANITGQLFFNAIKDGLTDEGLIGDQLVSLMPSNIQGPELIPGVGAAGSEFDDIVVEGDPYPSVGLTEEFVTIPGADKRGGIIGLTREVIIADKTGQLIERARGIGTALGIRREESILGVVLGIVNPYLYKGVARNTYANAAMGFDNVIVDALVNYTDLQAAENIFSAMRNPVTNKPFSQKPNTIICSDTLKWTASAVIHDVQVRLGDISAAPGIQSIGGNRVPWKMNIESNEYYVQALLDGTGKDGLLSVANRGEANLHWYIGNPKGAFVWKQVWPLTVEEAPNNSEVQFTQDVWMRFKASYKGVAGVKEPRLMIRSDGTA